MKDELSGLTRHVIGRGRVVVYGHVRLVCPCCGREKRVEEFYRSGDDSRSWNRRTPCIPCFKAQQQSRPRTREQKDRENARRRARYAVVKRVADDNMLTVPEARARYAELFDEHGMQRA